MPTEIRVYYEGDKLLRAGLRVFFTLLMDRARNRRCNFRLIAAGAGSAARRDFTIAIKTHKNAWNILLQDSEGPAASNLSTKLCQEQNWDESQAGSIFWMVEMMESWFHADKDALEKFYGQGFRKNALKANPKVEEISKADLKDGLQRATKGSKAGGYFDNKTSHGPKLLEAIDPDLVRKAAPNCDKLFTAVLAKLEA